LKTPLIKVSLAVSRAEQATARYKKAFLAASLLAAQRAVRIEKAWAKTRKLEAQALAAWAKARAFERQLHESTYEANQET